LSSSAKWAKDISARLRIWHDEGFEEKVKPEFRKIMFGTAGPACVFNGACVPH
jgi:hypothetical protein